MQEAGEESAADTPEAPKEEGAGVEADGDSTTLQRPPAPPRRPDRDLAAGEGAPGTATGQPDPEDAGSLPSDGASPTSTSGLDGRVIALDPGHNGGNFDAPEEINRQVDAGGLMKACNTTGTATPDGYRESTFNLEVAELVRTGLEEAGAQVHMTRSDDDGVGPCIDERGTIGQRVGADLTLSIHADGAAVDARGFHIIHPAAWSGSDPAVLAASLELAEVLRDALVAGGRSPANYVGSGGLVARNDLATLNLSEVPVVLLEAGNMRNAADAAALRDRAWQAALADALVQGIERFLVGAA